MADYTQVGWVDELTKLSAANFAQMDAGIKDAAEHQNSGSLVARPAADAAHKHHIWRDENGESWYCDGTQWVSMGRGVRQSPNTLVASAPGSIGNPKGIDSYGYTAWRFQFAQPGTVSVAELFLRREAGATGSYFFAICAEAVGGGPDEQNILTQWTADIATLPTTVGPATVFDIGPLMVTPGMVGVNFYIVTTPLFYTGAPGTFRWYGRSGATANGDFYYSLNSGTTWATEAAGPANIALYSADAFTLKRTLTRGNLLSVVDDVTGAVLARIANDGSVYGPGGRRATGADGNTEYGSHLHAFSLTRAQQFITSTGNVRLAWNGAAWDVSNGFNDANDWWVAPEKGIYPIRAGQVFSSAPQNTPAYLYLEVIPAAGGASTYHTIDNRSEANANLITPFMGGTKELLLNAGDKVAVATQWNSTNTNNLNAATSPHGYFQGHLARRMP